MDQAMLEKTKNDKILVRFIKKGGDTIKKFAQTILDNAASATKAKTEPPKPVAKPKAVLRRGTPIDIPYPHVVIRNPPSVTGQKRVREPEENAVPAPKRVVSPANAKPVTKPLPATTATTATTAAKPRVGTDTKPAPQNGGQAVKPKANIVTPKPTPSLFSSLMSASKRPGTSNAARAAAAAAAAKEKVKYVLSFIAWVFSNVLTS